MKKYYYAHLNRKQNYLYYYGDGWEVTKRLAEATTFTSKKELQEVIEDFGVREEWPRLTIKETDIFNN